MRRTAWLVIALALAATRPVAAQDYIREELRIPMPAAGVRGITLEREDAVIAAAIVVPDATLLVAGENGIGKRTSFEEYRVQSRGGKGIITMKANEKTGAVVGAFEPSMMRALPSITRRSAPEPSS